MCTALAACGSADDPVPASGASRTLTDSTGTATTEPGRDQGFVTEDVLGDVDVWTSIGQSRHLEGTNRIVVPLRVEDGGPLTVTSIAVRSPWFDPLPAEPKHSLLHPGRRADVQVDLGPARCGDGVAALATASVEVVAAVDGGPSTPLVLPVPTWLLEDLHERSCTLEAFADAVSVAFGDDGEVAGREVATEIVVRRRASTDRITLDRIAGSVILTLEPVESGTPLVDLASGEGEARVPVRVVASRCDPHGLSGSQKTFVFPVWVAIGEAEPVHVELRPGPALEATMREAIHACVEQS